MAPVFEPPLAVSEEVFADLVFGLGVVRALQVFVVVCGFAAVPAVDAPENCQVSGLVVAAAAVLLL